MDKIKSLFLFVSICLFAFFFIFLSLSYSYDLGGIYTGTARILFMGEEEEGYFIDILYQNGDSLFLQGAFGCETTNGYVELIRKSDNYFSLIHPFSCEVYDLEMNWEKINFSISGDTFTIDASGTVVDETFSATGYGRKINSISVLQPNDSISISGNEDDIKFFSLNIPPATEKLEVITSGGWGDCDIDLIYSAPPFYYYSSDDEESTNERIVLSDPAPGKWYVLVYGFEDFGGVKLTTKTTKEQTKTNPSVNLQVNSHDSFTTVKAHENILIYLSINPGDFTKKDADWWLIAQTPNGLEYFDIYSGAFIPGFSCTYQGQLFSFSNIPLRYHGKLLPGKYIFYFGIDLIKNGTITFDKLFYDYVEVDVTDLPPEW